MKQSLLLLFTLSSALCYGQTSKNPYFFGSYETTEMRRGELSLEEKLLLYAQECYNDSTINTYTVHLVEGGDIDDDPDSATACMIYFNTDKCINPNHRYEIRSETIHREPTFEGFLEWLKKK